MPTACRLCQALEHMNTPQIHDDPNRTTPVGLVRYATEFMEAALITNNKMGRKSAHKFIAPVPVMFLVGQSVELALKAFLLSRGISLRTLRRDFGHELRRSLKNSNELGLLDLVKLTEEEEGTISLLDDLYATKQLQYIVTGAKTFPVFDPLQRASLKLIHAIGAEVGYPPRNLPNVL